MVDMISTAVKRKKTNGVTVAIVSRLNDMGSEEICMNLNETELLLPQQNV